MLNPEDLKDCTEWKYSGNELNPEVIEAERVLFEADSKNLNLDRWPEPDRSLGPIDDYCFIHTGHRWAGWLARAALDNERHQRHETGMSSCTECRMEWDGLHSVGCPFYQQNINQAEGNSMQSEKIYEAIDSERYYQDCKWGTVKEHPHEVGGWLAIMRKLLTDAEAAWASSGGDYKALLELRKVLAVGVACAEQHGLPGREESPQDETKQQTSDLEVFEADAKENGFSISKFPVTSLSGDNKDQYFNRDTISRWQGWLAARSHPTDKERHQRIEKDLHGAPKNNLPT